MNWRTIKTAWQTAQDFGLGWTIRRVFYELQLRTGHHKRKMPKRAWREGEHHYWLKAKLGAEELLSQWRQQSVRFFFSPAQFPEMAAAIKQLGTQVAAAPPEGKARYFSGAIYDCPFPEGWFTNPFTDPASTCQPDQHWSEYPMYSPEYEDLKFIWEPGRFTIVYDLVRDFVVNDNQAAPERYWQWIASWIEHNPPHTGPHWKCGQETSLRLMAWYFGLYAFKDHPATTPTRFARFLGAVGAQAERVSQDYHYSYLQQSNHAVSEGLGLYATGLLFPQLKKASEWRKLGKHILEERADFLFREDGTYFQKSHNYLRFIVHAYLFVLQLGKLNGDSFEGVLWDRMKAALHYMHAVMDEQSGYLPNFGSNDGALVLPLNSANFRDFRPTVAATHFFFHQDLCFTLGPYLEDLVWLFGADALQQSTRTLAATTGQRFDRSGVYTLRSHESWMFTHAESYTDRPAHADALHVDLWWRGLNICFDPGTYLYYGHQPWLDAFKHTRFHNTVVVDGKDQMERAYRFTWGYWHNARILHWQQEEDVQILEAEHDGYERLDDPVLHRRAIVAVDDHWLIIDDLLAKATHDIELNWQLVNFPYTQSTEATVLHTPQGDWQLGTYHLTPNGQWIQMPNKLELGDRDQGPQGLAAFQYGQVEPALHLQAEYDGPLPFRCVTVLGPAGWAFSGYTQELALQTDARVIKLQLNVLGQGRLLASVNQGTNEHHNQ
ncbi:MAG: alginate lyase family protein [Bacteroidota bacterium]